MATQLKMKRKKVKLLRIIRSKISSISAFKRKINSKSPLHSPNLKKNPVFSRVALFKITDLLLLLFLKLKKKMTPLMLI
jgi:hypothetical protein